jgi:16S rRNA (cytidine1402-2'-O)-methyltransferase
MILAACILLLLPIGNLGDFTDRGKKVLSECDLIACEDTRVTKKLLSHLELSKPMISYREENERKQSEFLADEISRGNELHYYPMQDTRGLAILGFAW